MIAEAIALYRGRFTWGLALGLPVALADQVLSTGSIAARIALLVAAAPAFSLAYAGACALRQDEVPPLRTWVVAVVVGVVTFLPAALFFGWFVIVAILWLGLAGHAVPAVMAERLGVVDALRRTFQLGRADYVHAAGSFAALATMVQTPGVSHFFGCRPIGPVGWAIALGTSATATGASLLLPALLDASIPWFERARDLLPAIATAPEPLAPEAAGARA